MRFYEPPRGIFRTHRFLVARRHRDSGEERGKRERERTVHPLISLPFLYFFPLWSPVSSPTEIDEY